MPVIPHFSAVYSLTISIFTYAIQFITLKINY
ncbi:hypothetical protein SAMN05444406_1192 [Caldicoprobacter faecalis]|uniref:Uncharacterized protein n=1 Tax=Caldicoprobacter faecalis TaxID=937334 RepID=A0A1I5WRS2_9FIRM|nr:hypothetical protein SAMN05444406_1192 [Caldicoprobacter faecalis]